MMQSVPRRPLRPRIEQTPRLSPARQTPAQNRVTIFLVLVLLLGVSTFVQAQTIKIGSKAFTESVVLGEVATQLGRSAGVDTEHRSQLGGTRIVWEALVRGEIDAYPEYTGTIVQEILAGRPAADLPAALAKYGVGMTRPLGFNDTYAVGMTQAAADKLGIKTISDLQRHAELRLGFSNEFLDRKDGWPALRDRYALPQKSVTGLDHDLAYRAVAAAKTDVIDLYSTDAEIAFYKLRVLEDDRDLFPQYQAVFLYRLDLDKRSPNFLDTLRRLEGAIDAPTMIAMNARSKLDKVPEQTVASDFLAAALKTRTVANVEGFWKSLAYRTLEHLHMVAVSLAASILVAVPLGVLAFAAPRSGRLILWGVAAIYTIPSLALLAFMVPIPHLGLSAASAIVALFLYGLLPIVRNTHAGLTAVPAGLRESARVLGLPPLARLLRVDLPIASPSILAGIQTAAVLNVGTATLGALIGAGGYGQPILTGVRRADTALILQGAVPAAVMALLIQGGFGLLGRVVVPRGLRIKERL